MNCFLRDQIWAVGLHSDILALQRPFLQSSQNNYFFLGGLIHGMRETNLYSKKAPKIQKLFETKMLLFRDVQRDTNNLKYHFPSYPSSNATHYCQKLPIKKVLNKVGIYRLCVIPGMSIYREQLNAYVTK